MSKNILVLLIFVLIPLLQSCSISYFRHQDKLLDKGNNLRSLDCEINYSLNIKSTLATNSFGTIENTKNSNNIKSDYRSSVERVLENHNCVVKYETDQANSNFQIFINDSPNISALPQEWLTGLSFGLIPSWGKRPAELSFEFIDKISMSSKTYIIDTISINHISLFPIFWLTFFTLDDKKMFEQSLAHFIKYRNRYK